MASSSTLLSAPLLLLLLLLCQAALLLGKSHCPPSSCGDIHIKFPFRLSGDPHGCGDKRFELVCEGNRTVYSDSHSEKYFVTEISYDDSRIRFMYSGLLSDTNCLLPDHSFLNDPFYTTRRLFMPLWASFMNCTREVRSPEYVAIPCLSGSSSTTYVVVNNNSYQLLYLKNSCSFLTTVPIENSLSPGDDITRLLRKGFVVEWRLELSVLEECWEDDK